MAGPRDGGGELATLVQNAASRKPHLLFFYSRACGLCKRLAPDVGKVGPALMGWQCSARPCTHSRARAHSLRACVVHAQIEGSALPVSRICADNDKRWAPEVGHSHQRGAVLRACPRARASHRPALVRVLCRCFSTLWIRCRALYCWTSKVRLYFV